MNLPNNPIILLSVINTYLRDKYDDLDSLCDDLDISKDELVNKLKDNGYEYIKDINQFK